MSQQYLSNLATEKFLQSRRPHSKSDEVIGQFDPKRIKDLDFELDAFIRHPFGTPLLEPLVAETRGYVRFDDLIEGKNIRVVKARDGLEYRVVTKFARKLTPSITFLDATETLVDLFYLIEGACVWVQEGQEVKPGETIAAVPGIRKGKLKDAWREAQEAKTPAELWLVKAADPFEPGKPYRLVWVFEYEKRLAEYISLTMAEDILPRVTRFLYGV